MNTQSWLADGRTKTHQGLCIKAPYNDHLLFRHTMDGNNKISILLPIKLHKTCDQRNVQDIKKRKKNAENG
jgi:hypothetical protein